MRRKIWIDEEHFALCEVKQEKDYDYYHNLTHIDAKSIAEAMKNNGFCVTNIVDGVIIVNKKRFFFLDNEDYVLNQCSDIFDWFGESQIWDFTYYYDRIVFHHPDGIFYAAYLEDTSNYIKV